MSIDKLNKYNAALQLGNVDHGIGFRYEAIYCLDSYFYREGASTLRQFH